MVENITCPVCRKVLDFKNTISYNDDEMKIL